MPAAGGRIAAHFVQVNVNQRPPLQERSNPRRSLWLGQAKPIAVHVEHRVVAAAARPRLAVLGRLRRRIGEATTGAAGVGYEAIAAIRILQWIDQHQTLCEHPIDDWIVLRRQQVIQHIQRRIRSRWLVPVHTVGKPANRRQVTQQVFALLVIESARICKLLHSLLDCWQTSHDRGLANRNVVELTSLPTLAERHHLDTVWSGGLQREDVALDIGMGTDLLAPRMLVDLIQRRYRGIVGRAGRHLEWLLRQ